MNIMHIGTSRCAYDYLKLIIMYHLKTYWSSLKHMYTIGL